MSTKRTLTMKFDTDTGKTSAIKLDYCKSDLTAAGVKTAMDSLITANIFASTLTAKQSAQVVEQTVNKLF